MITEDYVSFETAKLLKEKGFDEITFTWYTGKGKFCVGKNKFDDYHVNHLSNMASAIDKNKCSAPTIQRTMKWLREIHKIYISVEMGFDVDNHQFYFFAPSMYRFSSKSVEFKNPFGEREFDTYEEAAEAAIKYCLENLI